MAAPVNFNEIPDEVKIHGRCGKKLEKSTRSVFDEIEARQDLLKERTIKCKDIGVLYEKPKKRPHRYTYKYFCVCPNYNPQYTCKHIGNIVIDRDVLTPEEHIVHLATPKENKGAPRNLPRFYQKKFIVADCTARVNRLAAPKIRRVAYALNNYKHVLTQRNLDALAQHLEEKPKVEYTSIPVALEWLEEEKRLKKVAKRIEKQRCKKLEKKILSKQRSQIKKIVCVLFEDMKDFLLNDQFITNENSTLVGVILETLREFTGKEFYTTSNIREYQKDLAFNLAVWINKFISNLNIHVAESPVDIAEERLPAEVIHPEQQFLSFLPIEDYVGTDGSEEFYEEGFPAKCEYSSTIARSEAGGEFTADDEDDGSNVITEPTMISQ